MGLWLFLSVLLSSMGPVMFIAVFKLYEFSFIPRLLVVLEKKEFRVSAASISEDRVSSL